MATIDVKPIVLRNALLNVATDDYAKHVSAVTLTPSSSTSTWQGLTRDASFSFPGSTTWTCDLEYAQDWETPDSLSMYLYMHEGETVDVLFEPDAGGLGWQVELTIAPGAIGGAVNAVATARVSLGVSGRPVPVPASGGAGN